MKFGFGLDSSILLIFFSNGLLFSLLLVSKGIRQTNTANLWLGLFTFLCTLYIAPWMLGHAGWYFAQPYRDILFYLPLQQVLVLGPIIFFYTQSLLNPSFRLSKTDWLHFIPGFVYLAYALIVFIADKVVLREYYFYADGRDKDLALWYQFAGLVSMSFYFLLSLAYYRAYRKIAFQTVSFAQSILFKWVNKYLIAFLCMQLLRVVFLMLFPEWGNFGAKWWYYISFSVLFYYIALSGYTNAVQSVISMKLNWARKQTLHLIAGGTRGFVLEEGIAVHLLDAPAQKKEDWSVLKGELLKLMEKEALYQNPLLTLNEVAVKLETNARSVSRAINQSFDMNFNDFVNRFRVEAFKQKVAAGQHHQLTLLALALDCGFNSKSTFNRAFKKHSGQSPKSYAAQFQQEQ